MTKKQKAGYGAFAVTMTYTSIGMTSQIWENFQTQSVKGLSMIMYILLCATCSSWAYYATVGEKNDDKTDWFIFIPNTIGVILTLVVLFQFYLYS